MAEADEGGGGGFFVDVVGESRWNLGRNCEPLVPMGRGPAAKILGSEVGHGHSWGDFFSLSVSEKWFQPSFNCRCKVVKIKSLNI